MIKEKITTEEQKIYSRCLKVLESINEHIQQSIVETNTVIFCALALAISQLIIGSNNKKTKTERIKFIQLQLQTIIEDMKNEAKKTHM